MNTTVLTKDQTTAGITSNFVISAVQCCSPAEGKMIYPADQLLEVEYDTKNLIVITDGSTGGTYRNHCNTCGLKIRDTFLHMQRTTLKVRKSTGKVFSYSAQVLPYTLEELGCQTTALDPLVYIWDCPDNCVLSALRTENVNMVKEITR